MDKVDVPLLLKEGMPVSTKLNCNGSIWHANIVFRVEDNKVFMPLLDCYLENILAVGSGIALKYSNEYYEYLFEGVVSSINPRHPAYITVNVNKVKEVINTRMFPRYDAYLAINIKTPWSGACFFAVATNICFGGILFACPHKFDSGEELEIMIYLPCQSVICAKGKIIGKKPRNNLIEYCLQFIDMDEINGSLLSAYFQSLEESRARMLGHLLKEANQKL